MTLIVPTPGTPGDTSKSSAPILGCLAVAIVLLSFGAAAIWLSNEQSRMALERDLAESLEREFLAVKNGKKEAVARDGQLLVLLSNDADCVRNLTDLHFFIANITPKQAESVAQLTNLRSIGFYDSDGADGVLQHATDLPIEKLFFEVSSVSNNTLRGLAKFPKLRQIHFEQIVDSEARKILESLPPDVEVRLPPPENNLPSR